MAPDPFRTGALRAAVLDAWSASPARFREDANAEEDLTRGGYATAGSSARQNAADAAARAGAPTVLRLRVVPGADGAAELRVGNAGAPLDAEGVAALASLRASAKRDGAPSGASGWGSPPCSRSGTRRGWSPAPRRAGSPASRSPGRTREAVAALGGPVAAELDRRGGEAPRCGWCGRSARRISPTRRRPGATPRSGSPSPGPGARCSSGPATRPPTCCSRCRGWPGSRRPEGRCAARPRSGRAGRRRDDPRPGRRDGHLDDAAAGRGAPPRGPRRRRGPRAPRRTAGGAVVGSLGGRHGPGGRTARRRPARADPDRGDDDAARAARRHRPAEGSRPPPGACRSGDHPRAARRGRVVSRARRASRRSGDWGSSPPRRCTPPRSTPSCTTP